MYLVDALRARVRQAVAFTGAGGKSAAMARLTAEMSQERPVILTTTTKLGLDQVNMALEHRVVNTPDDIEQGLPFLKDARSLIVTGPRVEGEPKWRGLCASRVAALNDIANRVGAILLIEADGARGRSLKAPGEHEPVVPDCADLVVPVVGLDVLGKPLDETHVHRPELMCSLLNESTGAPITPDHVARYLLHPQGGLQGVPPECEVRALLNKAETPDRIAQGREIAETLVASSSFSAGMISSVAKEQSVIEAVVPVAGVILAAGGSQRFPELKQLLAWRGKPLVWYAVQAAVEAGLNPVVVVIGADGDAVRKALAGEPVEFIGHSAWESGQSSSMKVGLDAVKDRAEAVIFLLADMPLVEATLVRALVEAHRGAFSAVVAPHLDGKRGNPVLFDRSAYPALQEVTGDRGGRVLIDTLPTTWIPWDESILFDIDTPDDLDSLRSRD